MLVESVPPTRASLLIHIQALPAGATLPVRMCIRIPQMWEPPQLGNILELEEILVCKRIKPPGGRLHLPGARRLMNFPWARYGASRWQIEPPGGIPSATEAS